MKTFTLFAICLVALLSSCGDGIERSYFTIRVDSLKTKTDTVFLQSKTLGGVQFEFFGTVGPDGCYSLDKANRRPFDYGEEIEFRGVHETGNIDCPVEPQGLSNPGIYLGRYIIAYQLTKPGKFVIRVKQPDNTFLTDTVYVVN